MTAAHLSSPAGPRLSALQAWHVWAWKDNPNGRFADFNPAVSCEEYTGEATGAMGH